MACVAICKSLGPNSCSFFSRSDGSVNFFLVELDTEIRSQSQPFDYREVVTDQEYAFFEKLH